MFYAENFTRRLSKSISNHFGAIHSKMCVTARNCKKFTKTLYLGVSRSFKIIDVDTTKKLVISACYDKQMSVPMCNCFHGRRASISKITTF